MVEIVYSEGYAELAALFDLRHLGSCWFLETVVGGYGRRWVAPCRAHLCLQAQTVTQADSMLSEFPASPFAGTTFVGFCR
ncbi:hypothetical protein ACFS07_25835 [Undibacterium arcticum]